MSITTKMGKAPFRVICLGLVIGIFTAGSANASFLFSGSSGNLSASVDFSVSGTTLTAVLTNTSFFDANAPSDVLTAVFFNISGNPTLNPVSALLTGGSSIVMDPSGTPPAGNVVGGEWAYGSGLSGAPGGATKGISSSGLNLFGNNNFPGNNLAGPGAPSAAPGPLDGVQGGILPAGWVPANDNGGLTGQNGGLFFKNSITFTLSFLNLAQAQAAVFSGVTFQYGTATTEPHFPGNPVTPVVVGQERNVPEPNNLALLGLGLIASGFALRRRSLQA
jgi:hypothetical protein